MTTAKLLIAQKWRFTATSRSLRGAGWKPARRLVTAAVRYWAGPRGHPQSAAACQTAKLPHKRTHSRDLGNGSGQPVEKPRDQVTLRPAGMRRVGERAGGRASWALDRYECAALGTLACDLRHDRRVARGSTGRDLDIQLPYSGDGDSGPLNPCL